MTFRIRRLTARVAACLLGGAMGFLPISLLASDGRHSRDESLFAITEYTDYVTHLASDELEGRGTGQPGIDLAAEYIADAFESYGVKPAGDNGTYFQNFTLALKRRIADDTKLDYAKSGRRARIPMVLHDDFRPFPFSASKAFEGGVVFVGYGIVDDDQDYNEYEDVDVTDKVVMVIRRGPEFAEFDPAAHQTFRAKASRANARGAAAMLIVNRPGDEDGLYPFDESTGGFGSASYGIPMLHITENTADALLNAADMPSLQELQKKIDEDQAPASAELKGVSVRGEVKIEPIDSPVRNVVGLIPGTGPQADEIIVLGAHYDHLGIRNKGEPHFNPETDISNGADDNASGTALVMMMARVYTKGEAPNRSILLILFTGEELGLLGSAHFTKNPTVDLSKCVAMLNFDMVGRLKNDRLEVGGMRTGGFEDMVMALGDEYGLTIRDGGGGRGPSDHTHFYNNKIPVLFFFTGLHRQYHKPDDDTHLVNFEGAMRIARFAADVIDYIDARPERPAYKEDTRRAAITRQDDEGDSAGRGRRDGDGARRDRQRSRRPQADAPETAPTPRGVRLGIVPDEDDGDGVPVAEVADGSPAALAGVKPGDRIVRIGKIDIKTLDDAVEALSKLQIGDETSLGIVRKDKTLDLKVLFAAPAPAPAPAAGPASDDENMLAVMAGRVEAVVKRIQSEKSDAKVTSFTLKTKKDSISVEVDVSEFKTAMEVVEPFVKSLPELIKSDSAGHNGATVHIKVTWPAGSFETSVNLRVNKSGDKISAHGGADAHAKAGAHGHGGAAESEEVRETMPAVRLGIMPTYGEGEGEGYEIEGVIEGGPAATAGMKDGDRIYKIGDKKITNVYEYMDALRSFKPGDEIPIVIIRDGKKIDLKVKASGAKTEAQ